MSLELEILNFQKSLSKVERWSKNSLKQPLEDLKQIERLYTGNKGFHYTSKEWVVKEFMESVLFLIDLNDECRTANQTFEKLHGEYAVLNWLIVNNDLSETVSLCQLAILESFRIGLEKDLKLDLEKVWDIWMDDPTADEKLGVMLGKDRILFEENEIKETIIFFQKHPRLYEEKLEKYSTTDNTEIHYLKDDHPEVINQDNLEFHLRKRGIF